MEWYWWLLIGLALFVIVAIVMGILIYRMRRRERRVKAARELVHMRSTLQESVKANNTNASALADQYFQVCEERLDILLEPIVATDLKQLLAVNRRKIQEAEASLASGNSLSPADIRQLRNRIFDAQYEGINSCGNMATGQLGLLQ
jgi:hypothetical protein